MEPLLTSQIDDPRLLIGIREPDDAAVYQIDDETAIIFTADFITPVVDDAFTWGAIAAANSISDVYAMGGRPVLALNIVGFPKDMPTQVSRKVIEGGLSKAKEAGVLIVGGHTVEDEEPKFGMAVIGFVHPDQLIRKGGAKVGDKIVLTKPIGSGLLAKCGKNTVVAPEDQRQLEQHLMLLNKVASEVAVKHRVKGGTDITGFAILGHATEMAKLAGVQFRIKNSLMPVLPAALEQAQEGSYWPTKTWENEEHFGDYIEFAANLESFRRNLLYSPETSGGLLLTVAADEIDAYMSDMQAANVDVWVIGEVVEGRGIVVEA